MEVLSPLRQVLKGTVFNYRFMVAGGAVKTIEQAEHLIKKDVVHEWGSISTNPQAGNGGRDYYAKLDPDHNLRHTFNSIGLTNPGMDYVERHAERYIRLCADADLPSWVNISGNGVDDTMSLLHRAVQCKFRVITVNGACPNKKDQPILCDDFAAVDEFFDRVDRELGDCESIVLWKLSAGMRRPALRHNRERFRHSRVVSGIVACNTVPNGLDYLDNGQTAIKTANGIDRGGFAGPAILPITLDHTQFMAEDIPNGKFVVGCGGAESVSEVRKYFKAGAILVQCMSAFREHGEDPDFIRNVNEDIYAELTPA